MWHVQMEWSAWRDHSGARGRYAGGEKDLRLGDSSGRHRWVFLGLLSSPISAHSVCNSGPQSSSVTFRWPEGISPLLLLSLTSSTSYLFPSWRWSEGRTLLLWLEPSPGWQVSAVRQAKYVQCQHSVERVRGKPGPTYPKLIRMSKTQFLWLCTSSNLCVLIMNFDGFRLVFL